MRGELLARRMRIRKGRVMHRVTRHTGGGTTDLESVCRKASGIRGVKTTYPRVAGPEEEWSQDRHDMYPDCQHCPAEEDENV